MGDQFSVLTPAEARHLLRRTGFGVMPKDLARILDDEEIRGQAVARLLDFKPTGQKPGGRGIEDAHNKWIKVMIKAKRPIQEKLTLFWHDHFATSNDVVGNTKTMANQNKLFRQNCKGSFKDLVKAVNRDAAMIEFLDTVRNNKYRPNENYARELMELFTLGVHDFNGQENYTQDDIVQIARAFSGWRYEWRSGKSYFNEDRHDFSEDYMDERGPKVIFTTAGGFGAAGRDFSANGEGAIEIDTVTDILFDHRDSEGRSTVARHLTRRLFTYFAHENPSTAVIDQLIAASGFTTHWNVSALLHELFCHDAFYESSAPAPWASTTPKSVKWPVDYVVGTLRMLQVSLRSKYLYVDGGSYQTIRNQLSNMGQSLFEPPSVFGWDWENAWLNSATLLARYGFARDMISSRGRRGLELGELMDLTLTDPTAILDAALTVLGIPDQLTTAERTVLIEYLTDSGASPTLDLMNDEVRNTKLHGLFGLILQSPGYQLH